jgi:hypothetical protein
MFKSLVILSSVLFANFALAAPAPIDGVQALASAQKICPQPNAIQVGLYYTDYKFGSIMAQQASDGKISIVVSGLQPDAPYAPAGELCWPASSLPEAERQMHPDGICKSVGGTPRNELYIDIIPSTGPSAQPSAQPSCVLKLILKSENGPDVVKPIFPECGTSQTTIAGRMQNCAAFDGSSKTTKSGGKWALVARRLNSKTSETNEVWMDLKTGLAWGDRVEGDLNRAINTYTQNQAETACGSKEALVANAGITEKIFSLPSKTEFVQANKDGIAEILPHVDEFWTSTVDPKQKDGSKAFAFDLVSGQFDSAPRNGYDYFKVRCAVR